ncbi:MAG: glycosyltransferase family 9 protein [Sulfobacillus sp.]
MKLFAYRYRPVHAISEKLLAFTAALIPAGVKDQPVGECPRKVLVLKFGGMGEAVLARSLVERLRERNPSTSFDFLVEKRTAEMMTCGSQGRVSTYSPGADGMGKALATLREIRSRRYDAALDFEQHSLLTAAFIKATSIPVRMGFIPSEPSPRGQMFSHSIQLRESESMWSAFVRLGRVLDPGLPEPLMTVPLPCSAESEAWFSEWRSSRTGPGGDGPVVAMHLGVGPSAQYRRWPIERFADLATALAGNQNNLTVVLTGAKSEQPLIEDFRTKFDGRVVEALDLGGLERTATLLRHCDLLISSDTGIMHLGAAMGTPTVGLFGPNTPVCWAPVGPRATYVYPTRQPCSPCMNSYRRHIPEKCTAAHESACMWDITIEDVLNAARTVVRNPWIG